MIYLKHSKLLVLTKWAVAVSTAAATASDISYAKPLPLICKESYAVHQSRIYTWDSKMNALNDSGLKTYKWNQDLSHSVRIDMVSGLAAMDGRSMLLEITPKQLILSEGKSSSSAFPIFYFISLNIERETFEFSFTTTIARSYNPRSGSVWDRVETVGSCKDVKVNTSN